MVIKYRHIGLWLSTMFVLLCQACSSSDGADAESPDVKAPSQLEIHVYTPGHPVVTRADVEKVNPDDDEKVVNSLQIWVFVSQEKTSAAGTLHEGDMVGYLSPQISTPSSTEFTGKYQLTVSDLFAELKPKVNVYVVANVSVSNTGCNLSENSTMEELENALIQNNKHNGGDDFFGISSPMTTVVPEGSEGGLPMSGVLKGTEVGGSQPVLKVQTPVTVVRAVSKVRFVFSRTDQWTTDEEYGSSQKLKITGITIDNGMIPKAEYLFLAKEYNTEDLTKNCHVLTTYESGLDENGIALTPLTSSASQIPEYANPSEYSYTGEKTGQEYEDLINGGIEAGHLAEVGKFYLRESDKLITGKIHYTIGEGDNLPVKSSTFRMKAAYDFSRNHTWIVFGYFSSKEILKVASVELLPWAITEADREWYNW